MQKLALLARRWLDKDAKLPVISNPTNTIHAKAGANMFHLRAYLKRCQPFFALLAVGLVLCGCSTIKVANTGRCFDTVVIDAGHGGRDSGAARRGVLEKHAALDVARTVERELRNAGFKTVMTRKADYFVPLNKRAAISNRQNNAVFVSIHWNASRNRRARGPETFYNHPHALKLARSVQRSLKAYGSSRRVKKARFRVLRKNRFPAVLVECGFLTNGREARKARSSYYRRQVGKRIARGIIRARPRMLVRKPRNNLFGWLLASRQSGAQPCLPPL
jgi:N-acetylmuramoyl-L-alanine amidase